MHALLPAIGEERRVVGNASSIREKRRQTLRGSVLTCLCNERGEGGDFGGGSLGSPLLPASNTPQQIPSPPPYASCTMLLPTPLYATNYGSVWVLSKVYMRPKLVLALLCSLKLALVLQMYWDDGCHTWRSSNRVFAAHGMKGPISKIVVRDVYAGVGAGKACESPETA